jgi:hypothetical protein
MDSVLRMPHQVAETTTPTPLVGRRSSPLPAALGMMRARHGMGTTPPGQPPGIVPYQPKPFASTAPLAPRIR